MDVTRLLDPMEEVAIAVLPEEAGGRLDRVLAARLLWASRARVARWIGDGRVRVDGQVEARASRPVRAGQKIEVRAPKTPRDLFASIDDLLRIPVVHRGDGWLAVEKPPGVLAHPAGGTIKRTLLTVIAVREAQKIESGGPWLPHRLDKETSGLIIVAVRKEVQRRFQLAFEGHEIRRFYHARVRGGFPAGVRDGTIDAPLRVLDEGPPTRVVVDPSGAPSITRYRVIGRDGADSILEVEAVTGRMHQLRAHLAHAGHPIAGDPLLDPGALKSGRMALHASRLEIPAAVAGARSHLILHSDPGSAIA